MDDVLNCFWPGYGEPWSLKRCVVFLLIVGLVVALFTVPVLDCPRAPHPVPDTSSTSAVLEWVRNRCPGCLGTGRVTVFNRLRYGKPRADTEDSALPDANP